MSEQALSWAHGLGLEPVAPDWPVLTLDEVAEVLHGYPRLGRAATLLWHSPRPFSAAGLVATEEGTTLFVKRHHRCVREPAWLAEEHGFIAHLRRQGLPMAEVLQDASGQTAIARGDWTYEVHRPARGLDRYREALSWTPFLNPGDARAAGHTLGLLHRAAAGYAAPARRAAVLVARFDLGAAADPLAALAAQLPRRPGLARYLAERDWQSELVELLPWQRQLQPRLLGLPALWTHNDWHPSNLLWDGAGVASILDFGLCDRTFALFDLATAIERTLVPWLELAHDPGREAELEQLDALLAGYAATAPLRGRDYETLAALLPVVHLDFALAEVDYYAGIVGSRENADLAYEGYLLGHARWFQGGPGQRLLARIRRHGAGVAQ